MTVHQEAFTVQTRGRGTQEITDHVQRAIMQSGVRTGLCTVSIHHTSASLVVTENADPEVRRDLERFLARLVPDGDPIFEHTAEGDDDMPAHVRSVLTQTSISLPVTDGRCGLGTWQGIFVWEHRHAPHQRKVTVTVVA